jgi:hypothetical protein
VSRRCYAPRITRHEHVYMRNQNQDATLRWWRERGRQRTVAVSLDGHKE